MIYDIYAAHEGLRDDKGNEIPVASVSGPEPDAYRYALHQAAIFHPARIVKRARR